MLHPRWILGFWIVARFSLCGGDDACQSLLMLDPPEVVGELGEDILVNCTTSEESPDAVFWTYDGTESELEEEKNFLQWPLHLSKWNTTAKCTVKLNETFECSKDLQITVYKLPTLKLSFPHPMSDGNDYELKCDIMNVTPVQNLVVTWFAGNQTLHTQTFNESSVIPVSVVSTLNITADRRLIGEVFRCDAKLDLGPLDPEFQLPTQSLFMALDVLYPPEIQHCPGELTAVEQVHSLDLLPCDADGNPAVTVQWYLGTYLINASEPLTRGRSGTYTAVFENTLGKIETSVKVNVEYPPELTNYFEELVVDEGANVSLACEAEGAPLLFNWTCNGQNMNVSASVLNISHVVTNGSCMCMIHNHLGDASKVIRLHVVTPQRPSMPLAVATPEPAAADTGCPIMLTPAEVAVRFGDPVTINCTSSTTAVLSIAWEVPTGEERLQDTVATWSVRQMTEWSGDARCILNLGDRLCSTVPNITLYKPPDNVSVRIPDLMLDGVDYQLTCDITSVAPVQNLRVTWFYGIETLETQTFNKTATAPVNVSSVMNVTAKAGHNGGFFRCEAQLDLGPNGPKPLPRVTGEAAAVVHYRPVFRSCLEIFSGLENVVNLDMVPCRPDGNPAASVQWYHEGKEVNASEPLGRTRSGTYVAKAENLMGTSNFTINIAVEHEPSLSCQPSYEVAENQALQTVCKAGGLPGPVVSWFRDGKELKSSHQWKKEDSGNYSLRATNKHGTVEHELYLDVLYAPRFSKGNSTVEVTPGENVILECSAEANPSAEIQWIFHPAANVVNTTGWRRSVLTVNKATSANAGVYICVAMNKVGSVTRFDTLRMKDPRGTYLAEVFWALMILVVVLLIIGLIVCFATCKTRKKHRRYSFIPSSSRNDSERSYPLYNVQ